MYIRNKYKWFQYLNGCYVTCCSKPHTSWSCSGDVKVEVDDSLGTSSSEHSSTSSNGCSLDVMMKMMDSVARRRWVLECCLNQNR